MYINFVGLKMLQFFLLHFFPHNLYSQVTFVLVYVYIYSKIIILTKLIMEYRKN
jgi:hypothetical protein